MAIRKQENEENVKETNTQHTEETTTLDEDVVEDLACLKRVLLQV